MPVWATSGYACRYHVGSKAGSSGGRLTPVSVLCLLSRDLRRFRSKPTFSYRVECIYVSVLVEPLPIPVQGIMPCSITPVFEGFKFSRALHPGGRNRDRWIVRGGSFRRIVQPNHRQKQSVPSPETPGALACQAPFPAHNTPTQSRSL